MKKLLLVALIGLAGQVSGQTISPHIYNHATCLKVDSMLTPTVTISADYYHKMRRESDSLKIRYEVVYELLIKKEIEAMYYRNGLERVRKILSKK